MTKPKSSHAKPRKQLTREESDALRVDHIAQQLEEIEQEQLIERLYFRYGWARGD